MTRRTRTELLRLFEPALGQEAATALVEEFEVVDADQLATKADLAGTADQLRRELASKTDLATTADQLRQELASKTDLATTADQLRQELASKTDLATTGDELHHRIDLLEGRLDARFGRIDERFEGMRETIERSKNEVLAAYRGEIADAVSGQTRAIIFAMFGTVASMGGLVVAVTQLG